MATLVCVDVTVWSAVASDYTLSVVSVVLQQFRDYLSVYTSSASGGKFPLTLFPLQEL